MRTVFAHSILGAPPSKWERLDAHSAAVAASAATFAERFDAADWGAVAGWLHDLGKAKPRFQRRLAGEDIREPHAGEGAKASIARYGPRCGAVLAPIIAGHHAGLPNALNHPQTGGPSTPLQDRLKQAEMLDPSEAWALPSGLVLPPAVSSGASMFAWAFFARMLFSCLTDADSLETERFYAGAGDGEAAERAARRGHADDLPALKAALDERLAGFGPPDGEVNALRAEVLAAARARTADMPGLFSLTVPTGGGKTFASLAFALEHAIAHNLDRVVYVIPFTSIIEQTAGVFRDALKDDDAILEHHSAFDWDAPFENDEAHDGRERLRLAVENWDRPIVVTTAVQFFESLYSNRKKQCRKLHRLARSVIVLDEAQTIPPPVLRPCLAAIRELARGYGASAVFCTATQPAVTDETLRFSNAAMQVEVLPEALPQAALREIAPEPERLYERLKRVTVTHAGELDDAALIERLTEKPQALCIVNNRRHARELYEALGEAGIEGAAHLTTAMVPAHRRAALARHRETLKEGRPIRLIATSLIEAGVDVDFPAVFRAEAGIDSIAQAAGRCNREGKLGREAGRVTVFAPATVEGRGTPKELEQFIAAGKTVMRSHNDPLSLDAVRAYFTQLYGNKGADALDAKDVVALAGNFGPMGADFVDIATAFRMIETTMLPVIVPDSASEYGAEKDVLKRLEYAEKIGGVLRPLQQHIVQIPRKARRELIAQKAARVIREEEFGAQFVLLTNDHLYTDARGLDWSDPTYRDSESMVL